MEHTSRHGWPRQVMPVLLGLLAVRLLAMTVIPLNDTTEARYAEIARKQYRAVRFTALLQNGSRDYIAVDAKELGELPPLVRTGFEEIDRFRNMKDATLRLRERLPAHPAPSR